MSLPPLTALICVSQGIPRTTVIHNLLAFFANADGMVDITATRVKKPIGGTVSLEVANEFLNHASDAELNHIWIDGMLGDLNCWASFYLPDQPLMIERPRFIKLSIEEGLMSRKFRDEGQDPAYSDYFALSCIAFCEQVQAFFAPFIWLQFEGVLEQLAWYGEDPLQTSIKSLVQNYPLVYCDAPTYALLLQVQDPNVHPRKLISLPSGAKALYGYRYMPWFNSYELLRTSEWLRQSLASHLAIQGVVDLINHLKDCENLLPSASNEEDKETFRRLEAIRLLWATALQRQEVLSVMLPTQGAASAGVIPIVADSGREWCLYTDQQIENLAAPTWSGPDGIWTHALALRDATQLFPINKIPPRVVVVAWSPLSRPAHAALTEAGITIIPSTQPVPLIAET